MGLNKKQDQANGSDSHLDQFLAANASQIAELREIASDFRNCVPSAQAKMDPKHADEKLISSYKLINVLLDKLYALCTAYRDSRGKNIECSTENITYCLANIFESIKFDGQQRAFLAQVCKQIKDDLSVADFHEDAEFKDICQGPAQSNVIGQYCGRMLTAFNTLTGGANFTLMAPTEAKQNSEVDHLRLYREAGKLVYYFEDQKYEIKPKESGLSKKDIETISSLFNNLQKDLWFTEKKMSPEQMEALEAILKQTSDRGHTILAPVPAKLAEQALPERQLSGLLQSIHDIFDKRLAYLLAGKDVKNFKGEFVDLTVRHDELVTQIEGLDYAIQRSMAQLNNNYQRIIELTQKIEDIRREEEVLQTDLVERRKGGVISFDRVKDKSLQRLNVSLTQKEGLLEQIQDLKADNMGVKKSLNKLVQAREDSAEELKTTLDKLSAGVGEYQGMLSAAELGQRVDTLIARQADTRKLSIPSSEPATPTTPQSGRSPSF